MLVKPFRRRWPNMAMAERLRTAHEGRDFRAFDDVALSVGLVEPSLCRFFCLLGIVVIVGHLEQRRHLLRIEIEEQRHHRAISSIMMRKPAKMLIGIATKNT